MKTGKRAETGKPGKPGRIAKIAKKGEVEFSFVKLIVAIVILFALLGFFSGFFDIFNRASQVEQCRASVIGNSAHKTFGKSFIQLKCPRKEILVENNLAKYRKDENEWPTLKRFNEELAKNPEQFYNLTAAEMEECWWKMGEGRMDVFDSDMMLNNRHTCIICTQFQFNTETEIAIGNQEGFVEYLKDAKGKRTEDKSYYDYMKMDYAAQYAFDLNPLLYYYANNSLYVTGESDYTTNKEYVVFFKGIKYSVLGNKFGDIMAKFSTEKEKDAFFRMDNAYYVYFGTPEDVQKACNIMIN